VLASGTVKPEDADKIVPYIDIKLEGSSILKSQLILLDILAHNNWERPIYYVTGYHDDALGLEEYFQLEGLAYRLVPIKSEIRAGWSTEGLILIFCMKMLRINLSGAEPMIRRSTSIIII
jgi:hypothetical protein